MGTFALDDTRDRFASEVRPYFTAWTEVLAAALKHSIFDSKSAHETAEDHGRGYPECSGPGQE